MDDIFNDIVSSSDFLFGFDEEVAVVEDAVSTSSPLFSSISFSSTRVVVKDEAVLRDLYKMMQQPLRLNDNIYLFYRNSNEDTRVFYEDYVTRRGSWKISVRKGASRTLLFPPIRFHSANGLHNYLVKLAHITTEDSLTAYVCCDRSDKKMREKILSFIR